MAYRKLYTLVFIQKGNQILLGYKKRGFGKGKWNGFGGKVEPGETIQQAAIREMKEESDITIQEENLHHFGHLEFYFQGEPLIMDVKVFSATVFEGQAKESEEMKPKWFNVSAMPVKDMWLDDPFWLPLLLKKQYFVGKFWFRGHNEILRHDLTTVQMEELNAL